MDLSKVSAEGKVDFSGTNASAKSRGGGSGGSVRISAHQIDGTGSISVSGGSGKKDEGGAGSAGFLSITATVIRDGDLELFTSPGEGYQGDSFKTSDTVGIANVTVEAVDLLPKAEFESDKNFTSLSDEFEILTATTDQLKKSIRR